MNIAIITKTAPDSSQPSSAEIAQELLAKSDHQVTILEDNNQLLDTLRANRPDIALIVGEDPTLGDGHIQEMVELLDVAYVGTSAQVCRAASDISALSFAINQSFEVAEERINATWPKQHSCGNKEFEMLDQADAFDLVAETLPGGYPLVVVSAMPDSATPAQTVNTDAELRVALETLVKTGNRAVVYPLVEGVALTVCLLGSGWDAFVLPAVELSYGENAKEAEGVGEKATCYAPVRLESLSADQADAQAIRAEIERAALDVYAASGIRDWGSVDMIWDGARAQVIGVHCVPSLLPDAPFAHACEAVGLTFEGIINRVVEL